MSTYDDASLILYPSGYKEDKIYSLKPTDGSGDLTFTRASTATRVNAEGLIENAFVLGGELVTNGDFATDTDWTKTSTVTISSGNAHIISDGSYQYLAQNTILTIGKKYKITYEIIENTLGLLKSNTTFGVTTLDSSVGVHTFEAVAANASLLIERVSSCNIKIDNVSVKEVITLNVPRIDYTGGNCGKLLLEPQRTNLVTYSENFDNAAWTKSGATITANATTSPDGTTNADSFIGNGSYAEHLILQSLSFIGGTTYTISFYAKKNTNNFIQVVGASSAFGANVWANFDLNSGVVGSVGSSTTASIQNVGDGWYRCTAIAAAIATTSTNIGMFLINSSTSSRAESNSLSTSVYLYGAQAEAGSYVSSYVPTLASSVTRLADAASKTGISSLIGQTEGTLFAEVDWNVKPESGSPVIGILTLNSGANNVQNAILLGMERQSGGMNRVYCFVFNSNVVQAELFGSSITDGTYKIALAYKANDFALYVNGSQIATDTSGSVPALNEVLLGKKWVTDTSIVSDRINQALLFKTRLTNDQLADLTGGNKTTFNALATFYGYQIL